MKKTRRVPRFHPEEVLLCLTTECNLNCPHCITPRSGKKLSRACAVRFLRSCRALGIRRVGFTGGEPFLEVDLLARLVKYAVRQGMLFDRIMTNAVWFRNRDHLKDALGKLYDAGYDGSICVSVDAFHKQDLKKVALFIKEAFSIWRRGDLVSIAYTTGAFDDETADKLKALAHLLGLRLVRFSGGRICLKGSSMLIKIESIELSPIGKVSRLKEPWDGRWFKEDYCRGPGNIFFVMPDGAVKPCCGYASDRPELTIGNIGRDTASDLLKKFSTNRFAATVFHSGLAELRKRLEKRGVRFPAKASGHCYFCHYILTKIPRPVLENCLD